MKRITLIGFVLTLFTVQLISPAGAQTSAAPQDQSSLGDYARKIRKDPGAPKARPKVFDNDNLPTDDKLSVIGDKSAANTGAAAPGDDKNAAGPKADDDQAKKQAGWKGWQDKLTAQKDQVDLATRELDVLTREYQLRAAAISADAGNRLRNSAQWDKEDADYKQKIADKQKSIETAKQKLTDMQEEARKDGVPSAMID